jgi:hypothetical protein
MTLLQSFILLSTIVGLVLGLAYWFAGRFAIPRWVHGAAVVGASLGLRLARTETRWNGEPYTFLQQLALTVLAPFFIYLAVFVIHGLNLEERRGVRNDHPPRGG